MPLSYSVQSQADPDHTTYFQVDFVAETIVCASLSGAHFQANTRKVNQLLNNYLAAEMDGQWIISIEKRANGRDEFDALCRHYSGEGNVSRRVTTVYYLQETLRYKSESVLSFNKFLDRMQKILNIFRDKGEQMANITQVRKLFRRVQHPQLQDTFKALEVRSDLYGITYSEEANHLTAAVSNIP